MKVTVTLEGGPRHGGRLDVADAGSLILVPAPEFVTDTSEPVGVARYRATSELRGVGLASLFGVQERLQVYVFAGWEPDALDDWRVELLDTFRGLPLTDDEGLAFMVGDLSVDLGHGAETVVVTVDHPSRAQIVPIIGQCSPREAMALADGLYAQAAAVIEYRRRAALGLED